MSPTARVFGRGALVGLASGAAGVAVMTLGEKVEQAVTGRPSSFVPAHTLERLLGLPTRPDSERVVLNQVMHWGQGILLAAWRGVMAEAGLRGPLPHVAFTVIRLSTDQTLENATGVGAPPPTWPRDEQVVDVLHKVVYAVVTGLVADRLASTPPPASRAEGGRRAALG